MRAYFEFILRHRGKVLVAILLVTAAAAACLPRAVVSSSLGKLFLGNSPEYSRYRERIREFGSDESLVVAFEEETLLSEDSLRRLQDVVARLQELPRVHRVDSLLDARHILGFGEADPVDAFLAAARLRPQHAAEVLEQLRTDPLAGGLLVSNDGTAAAVVISLDPADDQAVEDNIALVDRVLGAFHDAGYEPELLHRAGSIAAVAEIIAMTRFNIDRLFPIVCIVLVLAVWLMFRRLWPIAVSMAVAIVGVIWTMAIAILIDPEISILMAGVPAVILIISFSDVIHLSSAYLLELESAPDKREAILRSAEDVGKACIYTSMTTFVGFVSLSLVPTPAFRQLGFILGLGVALALLLAVTLVPVMFSYMRTPSRWRSGQGQTGARSQDLLDRVLRGSRRVSLRYPRTVILVFGGVLAASVAGMTMLTVESDLIRRLGPGNEVRRDAEYFDARFAGMNVLDVWVDLPSGDGVLDADRFAKLADYHLALERIPGIDKVASVVTVVEEMHRRWPRLPTPQAPAPPTRAELDRYFAALERLGGHRLDPFVDRERRTIRIVARLDPKGLRTTYRIGQEALEAAAQRLDDDVKIEASGIAYLMGLWLDDILVAQRRGLLLSFVTISIMMIVALRSVRAGLWSMIPNLLPLFVLGGWVGLFWDQVDSDTIMIAILALGIGVDDTIHFLLRYRIESRREACPDRAIERAYEFAGRGIVITTVILTLGFAPFALSDYFSLHILGTLLPLVLVVALAADLFLVPALGVVGAIRFPGPKGDAKQVDSCDS